MFVKLLNRARQMLTASARVLQDRLRSWTKPPSTALTLESIRDLARSKPQLVIDNALLRQQFVVLNRSAKRPRLTRADRVRFVLLASRLQRWKDALLIVKPETVLRWHRQGFRLFWKRKSLTTSHEPKLPAETIALIKAMAVDNRLWGADRIQGELLKLNIKVAKRTIQRYMRHARPQRPRGQTWTTFLRNHTKDSWACDFVHVHDLFFRPLFAFVLTDLGSRRIVHVGVTRSPTDAWVAQQLREAIPFDQRPRYLIRDNDGKFGATFARVAEASGIAILRTPYCTPRANVVCERCLGSVRRECTDHLLILGERHLQCVLGAYVAYFNRDRPHQGLAQALPERPLGGTEHRAGPICAVPVLSGLHHAYQRAA